MIRERYQNPVVGSTVRLRLFTFNANLPTNIAAINQVTIYFLDNAGKAACNPDGRTLITTIDGSQVVAVPDCPGSYYVDVALPDVTYVTGNYLDIWTVQWLNSDIPTTITNNFTIYPDLWYSTVIPVVYNFSFNFQPNRLPIGSKQFLIIEVIPNVPRATDLQRYYQNLAILGDLRVSIQAKCGPCMNTCTEGDILVDCQPVDFREKVFGYYQLDTEALDMTCGLYNVWFHLNTGGNRFISEKNQLLIFE